MKTKLYQNTFISVISTGLIGVVLGFIGPSLYSLLAWSFLVLGGAILHGRGDLGFWDVFFLLFMAFALPIEFVRVPILVCTLGGAIAGLIGSILATKTGGSPLTSAIICGLIALPPVTYILLNSAEGADISSFLMLFFGPGVLFLVGVSFLGGVAHYLRGQHVRSD